MAASDAEISTGTDLDVGAAQAFAMITDKRELQKWFAEDVSIDLREGGAFVFGGLGTYAPTATHLTLFDQGRSIGWAWPLLGVVGDVTLTVSLGEQPDTSRVDVVCKFPQLPAVPRSRELIDDLWRFYMGNLKELAEGGAGVMLPDFSDPAPEVRQSIYIAASRAAVFRALIDPALLAKWTYGSATVEPREGGRYTYGWSYEHDGKPVDGGPTKILEIVENERLVTDWPDWRGDSNNHGQKITWILEEEGSGTRLTLIHDGFGRAPDISDFPFGWAGFLESIRDVAIKAGI
jgi:uncharacterized protein YndB with AHSA1/START domain